MAEIWVSLLRLSCYDLPHRFPGLYVQMHQNGYKKTSIAYWQWNIYPNETRLKSFDFTHSFLSFLELDPIIILNAFHSQADFILQIIVAISYYQKLPDGKRYSDVKTMANKVFRRLDSFFALYGTMLLFGNGIKIVKYLIKVGDEKTPLIISLLAKQRQLYLSSLQHREFRNLYLIYSRIISDVFQARQKPYEFRVNYHKKYCSFK